VHVHRLATRTNQEDSRSSFTSLVKNVLFLYRGLLRVLRNKPDDMRGVQIIKVIATLQVCETIGQTKITSVGVVIYSGRI
jgi:hypothetical protein